MRIKFEKEKNADVFTIGDLMEGSAFWFVGDDGAPLDEDEINIKIDDQIGSPFYLSSTDTSKQWQLNEYTKAKSCCLFVSLSDGKIGEEPETTMIKSADCHVMAVNPFK